jgi:nucleoside-diphosphate-sugar epimerase
VALTRVAVVGAAGFIGNRTVEMLHRGASIDVVPVVRRAASLALSCRFAIKGVIADATDESSLSRAFQGCDAIVSSVTGSPELITGICRPLVAAAKAAGARRIIHISSQMVHGQSLAPRTTEDTPFPPRQPLAYNRAKAEAEGLMRSAASSAGLGLVILRPGIVYGPRSRWTGGIADDLLAGNAFLLRDRGGACNAVYVDNLVHAIELSLGSSASAGEAFFVNDDQPLSWSDLILPVADALGLEAGAMPRVTLQEVLASSPSRLREIVFPIARNAFRRLPRSLAHVLRGARSAAIERRPHPAAGPCYSREMALLQSNSVHVSNDKAARLLGYRPIVHYAEAMRRSISWLRFAGYPVR